MSTLALLGAGVIGGIIGFIFGVAIGGGARSTKEFEEYMHDQNSEI